MKVFLSMLLCVCLGLSGAHVAYAEDGDLASGDVEAVQSAEASGVETLSISGVPTLVTNGEIALSIAEGSEWTSMDGHWHGVVTQSGGNQVYELRSYTGTEEQVTVPYELQVYFDDPTQVTYASVGSMGPGVFKGNTSIRAVGFADDGLTHISESCFEDCTALSAISFPSGLTTIGPSAFKGCTSLHSVSLPDSLLQIGDNAFEGAGLSSVAIPPNVTSLGDAAFKGCPSLVSVTFKDKDDTTFNACKEIGSSCFQDCISLQKAVIPKSLQRQSDDKDPLGSYAFSGCTSITKVDCSTEELDVIPEGCFKGCSSLSAVTIPVKVKSIGTSAFESCTGLTSVSFASPNQSVLTSIGERAFAECGKLTTVKSVPNALATIGKQAFRSCANLELFKFEYFHLGVLEEVGEEAFLDCAALSEIGLPFRTLDDSSSEKNKVRAHAFKGCKNLERVTFGGTFPTGDNNSNAFSDCSALKQVYLFNELPDGAPSLGLPNDAQDNPTYMRVSFVVDETSRTIKIDRIRFRRKASETGREGSVHLVIPASILGYNVSAIEENACKRYSAACQEIKTLSFEKGSAVTSIGRYAFDQCHKLETVMLPPSVTDLGEYVFKDCLSLNGVSFETAGDPGTTQLKVLGSHTFSGCPELIYITLPEGLEAVQESAFEDCSWLSNITFPDTLTFIATNAFDGCPQIAYCRMPYSMAPLNSNDLGSLKFWQNSHMNSVTLQVTVGSWFESQAVANPDFLGKATLKYDPVDLSEVDFTAEDCTYNGKAQAPPFSKQERWLHQMVLGEDYEVDFEHSSCTNATPEGQKSTVRLVAVEKDGQPQKFEGSADVEFIINPADISNKLTCEFNGDCYWDNAGWYPEATDYIFKYPNLAGDGETYNLVADDFSISYEDSQHQKFRNKQVGYGRVLVKGQGNFTGTQDIQNAFPIRPRRLDGENAEVTIEPNSIPDQPCTGEEIKPALSLSVPGRNGEVTLTDGSGGYPLDYVITYSGNVEAGTATITIKAAKTKDGGSGVLTQESNDGVVRHFTITPTIRSVKIAPIPNQVYNGQAQEPELSVTIGTTTLTKGTDYIVAYDANTNAGTALANVTLDKYQYGNYEISGTTQASFTIEPRPAVVTADDKSKVYWKADPELTATVTNAVSAQAVTYTLSRVRGENVGKYTITASGDEDQGNYAVTFVNGTFTIEQADIGEATIELANAEGTTFDGEEHKPVPVVTMDGRTLALSTDYTVAYADNLHAGTATVTVSGRGNYKGSNSTSFEIAPYDISEQGPGCEVTVGFQVHTGEQLRPHPKRVTAKGRNGTTLTLVEGTDYETVEWGDNKDVGELGNYVTIEGKGDYCGRRTGAFAILNDGDLSHQAEVRVARYVDLTYTGEPIEPDLVVTLKGIDMWPVRDVDYTASFADNVNVGTATVTCTGINPLRGSVSTIFEILPADIAEAEVSAEDQVYGGRASEPVPTVTWRGRELVAGKDFTVSYEDNVHVGTATFTITGIGNFKGTNGGTFAIAERPLKLTAGSATREYDGTPLICEEYEATGIAPGDAVSSLQTSGSQTEIGSSENEAAHATIVNAAGEDVTSDYDVSYATGTLTVVPADLGNADRFSAAPLPDVIYDGSVHEPVPTITDAAMDRNLDEAVDFELSYADNVDIGTARVTVTGEGNYTGTLELPFRIVAPRYVLVSGPEGDVVADGGTAPEFAFEREGDDERTFDHFSGVRVDGKELGEGDFSARRGSVVITLSADYVKGLPEGDHTLTAVFDDGEGEATFTVAVPKPDNPDDPDGPNNPDAPETPSKPDTPSDSKKPSAPAVIPQTGDPAPAWPIVFLASILALSVATLLRRAHR